MLQYLCFCFFFPIQKFKKKICFYLMHIRLMSVIILLKNIDINTVRSDIFFLISIYFVVAFSLCILNICVWRTCWILISIGIKLNQCALTFYHKVWTMPEFHLIWFRLCLMQEYLKEQITILTKRAQMLFDRTEWKN